MSFFFNKNWTRFNFASFSNANRTVLTRSLNNGRNESLNHHRVPHAYRSHIPIGSSGLRSIHHQNYSSLSRSRKLNAIQFNLENIFSFTKIFQKPKQNQLQQIDIWDNEQIENLIEKQNAERIQPKNGLILSTIALESEAPGETGSNESATSTFFFESFEKFKRNIVPFAILTTMFLMNVQR
mmetsp:Transcript_6733/g.11750  ORF Transcript_6733/g.11750 Transcript_6733/m.11750 type:complete len:182 (-) Transcript_6733:73-618(-)